MSIGLEARVAHAEAVVLDALQHPACILKFVKAEHLAFIDGALSPAGSPVPVMLADEDYLAQAFLSGQEKRRNKYGFVLDGRWVYHQEVCKRCQKADYPIVKPHEVCGGCFGDYVREARRHEGAVDKARRQVDLAPGLQIQRQQSEQVSQDAIHGSLRAPKWRKQVGYDGTLLTDRPRLRRRAIPATCDSMRHDHPVQLACLAHPPAVLAGQSM